MAKFPAAHVFEASLPSVRLEPGNPTMGSLSLRTGDHQFSFQISRADLERLARQIADVLKSAPLSP